MQENYSYPLNSDWNQDDIVKVIALYNAVETAYEHGIKREDFLQKYRAFQQVVPMKMEQKQLDKDFEFESGYSIYQVFKQSQKTKNNGKVRIYDGNNN
ncbi:UPF0223 family protein [Companilactobacillus nodensis]|uniref:Uncharacterized protein n=1 Tax=Companilactobacillus nodensis DSM 19682 = JCM 14932 = NBRC 107160 TaxID=1423775 RepID=A0A0R1KI79_9LACO|nr:UPF0223 family protein [Companilactobacillus nodensis]KRK80676.1 hypothetical protein FD03_GL002104 [Companilactobacillus nodensis DSM 19682 = JCM 14932 = NBRC 107160]